MKNNQICIDCRESSVSKSFRNMSILKNVLCGTMQDNQINVPVRNLIDQMTKIKELSFKLEIQNELYFSDELKNSLEKAQLQSDKFIEFSEKARLIRNDIHDLNDFKVFSETILEMNRKLRPFQLLSAYHLAYSQNGGNFSVPGAGKTTVILAAYYYLHHCKDASRQVNSIVVICPIAAFFAWKNEFLICFGREPNVLEVYGGSEMSKKEIQSKLLSASASYDLILVGYQSAPFYEKDIEIYLRDKPSMLVLDEAHRIKKVGGGVWSDTVLRLAVFAKSRIVLTGTPAPQGYVDLKNLFDFMWPSKNVIGYSAAQLRDITNNPTAERVNDLMHRIEPFFTRVSKNDLKLPQATFHEPIMVSMDSRQETIYRSVADKFIPKLIAINGKGFDLSTAKVIRLRQIASNPSLILRSIKSQIQSDEDGDPTYSISLEAERYAQMGDDIISAAEQYESTVIPQKFNKTLEIVKRIINESEKVIIWCEFVGNVVALGSYLEKNEVRVAYLYGATPKDEREEIIADFNQVESKCDIIIANPQAVGESISLHKACHNAIYFEMSFNAASYMQSKDRIHRLGLEQGTVTNYYFLLSKNTIDETIYERVINKEKRMLDLIESRDTLLFSNNIDFESETSDDIKAIIRDYYKNEK